jgi:hypothetical protein
MNSKLCRIFILVSLLLFLSPEISAQENTNITSINQYYPNNWTDGAFDIAVQGDYAYLACRDDGLRIVNVSNLDSPADVGQLSLSYAYAIALSGHYAFVGCCSTDGIAVVDVSDPANPVLATTITTTGCSEVLKIKGNRLYSANGNSGMSATDITDPLHPEPLELSLDADVYGFDVHGDIVYTAGQLEGMTVWDFSDLASPVSMGNYPMDDDQSANDVAVKNGYAYIGCYRGLEVVDLATMQMISSIDSFYCSANVDIRDNLLYVSYGCQSCPLAILDITNPLSLQILSIYSPPDIVENFTVVGDLVYTAFGSICMRVVDITEPAAPVEVTRYNRRGNVGDVRVSNSVAYLSNGNCLTMLDVSNPLNPLEVGRYEPFNWFHDFRIAGNMAFFVRHVNSTTSTVEAVNVSDPTHPELIGALDIYNNNYDEIEIYNHYAMLGGTDGVLILDIADPVNMTEAGFISFPYGCYKITADDRYLYVDTINEDLTSEIVEVYEMTDPANPVLYNSWEVEDYCWGMTGANGLLFMSTGETVEIYDGLNMVSGPLATLTDFSQYQSDVDGITVEGNRLYLSLPEYGIVVYDIQDLSHPQFVGCFNTPGYARNSAVSGEILYLADGDNFGIYDCSQAVLNAPQHPEASVAEFALLSNYPNPFNSSTQIRFEVGKMTHVNLGVYDVLGRSVATLADRDFASGTHAITWNGADASGRMVASGRYFVMARAGDAVRSLPIVLLK